MAIDSPRLTPVVSASPRHPSGNMCGSPLTMPGPAKGMPTLGHTAHGQGAKAAPDPRRQKATMQLCGRLTDLQDAKRVSSRRLLSTPRSDAHTPHGFETETEISQKQFHADDADEERTSFEASDHLPPPHDGAPSTLVQSERHPSEGFRLKTPIPIGSTAAELKNVVAHRKGYTDQKKEIGLAGWGAGLSGEGVAAMAAPLAGMLVGVPAIAAWASTTSLATWLGNIYDGFEARGSFLLSEKSYEEALTLRGKAIEDRLVLATALAKEGKLEEGKAYLDAAREMVVMMDEFLKGHEGYLATAEADLLVERRALELRIHDELIDIKRGKHDQAELNKLLEWLQFMPEDKSKRDDALHDLKIQRADLEAELERLKGGHAADAPPDADAIATQAELKRVQANIDRLELINKQKKYPSLLRATKHLGPKKVKRQRDEHLTYIRLPPDIAATLVTFVGMTLGVAATGFVGPAATILLSPFWMRSARLDIDDAHRDRLTADANLTAILNKLALGRAMLAHFDDLPPDQQNDPQTRLGKSIAHNLISAALREYKQAMRVKKLSVKKELKGTGLRYVGIPAVVMFAGAAIVTSAIGVATGGIAFAVTAALTAIGVGAYYVYMAHLKKKAKQDKHEAKRRQAVALWVRHQMGDVRALFTSDSATVHAQLARLRTKAPVTLRPYITVTSLLHHNEYLMSMALGEEYANAPTDPAAPLDIDNAPFAVQMTGALGLTDQQNNFLLHNDPLLQGPEHKKKVALTTLASLFGGAKVYEADRLPDHAPGEDTDLQPTQAVGALAGTQDAKAVSAPPVGVPQFEQAIQQLGMAQKSERQQKRLKKGHLLLAGGRSARTPKQWLKHFDKKPLEKDKQISNLVSMWRDALRNPQGRIDVPEGFASEDHYLLHVMTDTCTQYDLLRQSVADHAMHEDSKLFDTLQERFDSSLDLATLCVEHLTKVRQETQQQQRAARAAEPGGRAGDQRVVLPTVAALHAG
jgi:hypothetical protein